MTQSPPNEAESLRNRAARCRDFAREYASDVGSSLTELAVELDKRADRLDAQDDKAEVASGGMISHNSEPQVRQ